MRLAKALYGMLKSALLFYKKLCGNLNSRGFAINHFNPCVANQEINGHQITVVCHVSDFKISYKTENNVMLVLNWLNYRYGEL